MTLYEDREFTFRFADDRVVDRFHLEGVPAGRAIRVFAIDPDTGARLGLLRAAAVGADGWVDLSEPIVVRAGEAFVAVPIESPLIRLETTADRDSIRQVNSLAFDQDDEARIVDELREGGYFQVSLVAEQDSRIVGHILFSDLPIVTETGTVPSLALAPMAVLPECQRLGIGSALIRRGLELCRERGHRIVVVLGHPRFYPRFGFSTTMTAHLDSPFNGKESFMALELSPCALDGVKGRVVYPPPFGV